MAITLSFLVVAGCGQAAPPYRPGEATTSAPVPAPAGTPTAVPPTAAPRTGTQTIRLSDDLQVRIEWPAKPDPLVKLIADYYVGQRKAVIEGQTHYNENLELDAEVIATRWVKKFADLKQSLRGVGRLYNLHVSALVGKGAQVDACVDESRLRLISTRTGKAFVPQPDWTRAPYGKTLLAHRGDDGVWRIRTFIASDEGCKR
jgi:hypothetical protein